MRRRRDRSRIVALAAALTALAAAAPAVAQVQFYGEASGARVRVMTWRDIPFRTVVRQEHDYSCGSAALATLLTYHYGRPTTEAEAFTRMYAAGDQETIRRVGFSMLDMKRYLAAEGLRADGFRMSIDDIGKEGVPVIALIQMGAYRHFVVVKGVVGDRVLVGDPALGLRIFTRAQFNAMWNGIAFALHDTPAVGRGRFNVANEWSPWSTAPLRARADATDTLNALTLHQLPFYQITPIMVLGSVAPGGGL
ncbi:conserved hypothetical protein [Phenylobacterium zucineum HLK1]|uniref:Peptidase C39 domain-containing protein n=1 Tax=Phenylobacterium zucineum (strain HLK1) TaxID=450851 RepID=B4RGJ1_PHEZH|nr:C39 family peptidase [Phenylobacterium zucineum]ACG78897.1 conserved hypothetical protein [Phenylobacterium zucineum HLK1]